jgi:hypothetical protein
MKQERVTCRRFKLGDGTALTVNYWLITECAPEGNRYGIALTDNRGRVMRIPNITSNRLEASWLLRRMANGFVTTVTARDIVIDYLGDDRRVW